MNDLFFGQQRDRALTVECEDCHAEIDRLCINAATGQPLEFQPAHFVRLRACGAVTTGREVARR